MTRVIIFGDSYVAAANRGPGYARLLPWLMRAGSAGHIAEGGTGFVASSGAREPYPARLALLLDAAAEADFAVVQASGNDAPCDLDEVEQVAVDFMSRVSAAFPRVALIGPLWAIEGAAQLPELNRRMRSVAAATRVQFVPTTGLLTPRLISADGAHPTWRGHAAIAWNLARALRPAIR